MRRITIYYEIRDPYDREGYGHYETIKDAIARINTNQKGRRWIIVENIRSYRTREAEPPEFISESFERRAVCYIDSEGTVWEIQPTYLQKDEVQPNN